MRADVCVLACAEAFRGDGEIVASPMGAIPRLGALLAKATFEPDLVLTDGVSRILAGTPPLGTEADAVVEGWMPYRRVFEVLWSGQRHVMMGASQLDQHGRSNISAIGDFARPKVALLGSRGAPGNTICHKTSYFVPNHSPKVFVPRVDFASGASAMDAADLGVVVTDLAVLDFETDDGRMRLVSVHPGVTVDEVVEKTGFELVIDSPAVTPEPDADQWAVLRRLDPQGQVLG